MNTAPTNVAGYDPTAHTGGCVWHPAEAARALEFFPRFLVHVKGKAAGEAFEPNPWERDFIATLYGWKRPDGTRRYREAFVGIPRKNNKTTLCAGLGLFQLLCDRQPNGKIEEGAEVYCAAADRDQASLVFSPAATMVAKNDTLAKMCTVKDSYKRIVFPARNSFLRAIPADAAGSHGFNASTVIIDELHTQPNRDLYDVLRTSMASRLQPLLISITTAGHDTDSICYELWDYGRKVRDAEIEDPYFLPCIYEAAETDDWHDPAIWQRVNPNYGRSVSREYLEEAFTRAQSTPAMENTFKNLHLNLWTEAEDRWLSSDDWNACQMDSADMPDFTDCECIAGLDLGSTSDLTALVYVFPLDGKYYVIPHFFCPEVVSQTAPKRYQGQYRQWIRRGWITTTPGNATDYEAVRARIREDAQRYNFRHVLFDAWQALDTHNQLVDEGFDCVKVTQSYANLWPGVKAAEEAVLSRTLVHDGNDVLRWMVASTVMDRDANGNLKPNKRKSHGKQGTRGKIDGVVAMVMAMAHAGVAEASSVYEDRGVLTI